MSFDPPLPRPPGRALVTLAALALAGGVARAQARRAPAFEPGEELRFQASYLKFDAGDLTVKVGREKEGGRVLWPLEVQAKTSGVVELMYRIQQHFVSEFEPARGRSVGLDLDSQVGGEHRAETVRYRGTRALIRETKDGRTVATSRPMLAGAQDLLATFYELRDLPLAVGSAFSRPVWSGRKSWRLTGRVAGEERVTTGAGTFATKVVRLRTHFGGKFHSDREVTVWISDDARRLPVQVAADFFVGTMKVSLVGYRPGGLTAERDR